LQKITLYWRTLEMRGECNSQRHRECETMRTVRNITVAVTPELYRQTRRIAADYDTIVTDMVRFLLLALPEAVKAARYPGGCPQFGLAAARAARAAASAPPAAPAPEPSRPLPGKKRNFALYACKCQ
jgi:hypothetical protein